jgi:hypothetical protein
MDSEVLVHHPLVLLLLRRRQHFMEGAWSLMVTRKQKERERTTDKIYPTAHLY